MVLFPFSIVPIETSAQKEIPTPAVPLKSEDLRVDFSPGLVELLGSLQLLLAFLIDLLPDWEEMQESDPPNLLELYPLDLWFLINSMKLASKASKVFHSEVRFFTTIFRCSHESLIESKTSLSDFPCWKEFMSAYLLNS